MLGTAPCPPRAYRSKELRAQITPAQTWHPSLLEDEAGGSPLILALVT